MKKIFKRLDEILESETSIIDFANEIEILRKQLKKEADITNFVNLVRGQVQYEMFHAVINNGGKGIIIGATGSGKSRVGVMLANYYAPTDLDSNLSLAVPTEKLRDENWKEEFEKWGAGNLWDKTLRVCYASCSKMEQETIDLLILDEGHNITPLSAEIFKNNIVRNVVLLTATRPTSEEKIQLLEELQIPVVYELTLDVAVQLGFVAPYKITVVYTELDNEDKYVVGGSKQNPFLQTEKKMYDYLTSVIESYKDVMLTANDRMKLKFTILKRMHVIYGLKTKTVAAKYLLDNVIPKNDRTIIFCGSIPQSEELSTNFYHSKSGNKGYDLFKSEQVNRLSCVKAINEGHNFPGVDGGVIAQINSKEKDLVQRIGRLLRFRPGHEGHLYIVIAKGTQDEIWAQNALANFDSSRIEYVEFKNLKK